VAGYHQRNQLFSEEVPLLFEFSMVFMFLALGAGFVLIALGLGALIRPRRMGRARNETYECGEPAIGPGWYNFNPRFYMLALVFLVFDVELVVTYPVVTVLRRWAENGQGLLAFIEIVLFIVILVSGYIFLWRRGDLEWIKKIG
jgi:NADH-quinone oxidoreductase subunit A